MLVRQHLQRGGGRPPLRSSQHRHALWSLKVGHLRSPQRTPPGRGAEAAQGRRDHGKRRKTRDRSERSPTIRGQAPRCCSCNAVAHTSVASQRPLLRNTHGPGRFGVQPAGARVAHGIDAALVALAASVLVRAAPVLLVQRPAVLPLRVPLVAVVRRARGRGGGAAPVPVLAAPVLLIHRPAVSPIGKSFVAIVGLDCSGRSASLPRVLAAPLLLRN
mmetsp:Transcript_2705/g.7274  ORF Transcript_2705/g.7274 Transcript_2705/m.7274 type:complete len:217 (+) Transcript_2705:460-1110(+)